MDHPDPVHAQTVLGTSSLAERWFRGLMIDWNDLLNLADLVREFPSTYSLC
jgi:hypothetical protein